MAEAGREAGTAHPIAPHMLRPTFATQLREAGTDIRIISHQPMQAGQMTFAELGPEPLHGPATFIAKCFDLDARAILVPDGVLPRTFFDLSSGVAGEVVQKLVNYGIRMAVVVPDLSVHSERFQEFAREANKRRQFGFFPDRAAAVAWLESA